MSDPVSWTVSLKASAGAFALDVHLAGAEVPVVVIGPNGSGKTTLLRAIAGALVPERGQIRVGARRLFDSDDGTSIAPEERRVGYVPQGYGLFPHLNVLDNVAFGLAARRQSQRTSGRTRGKRISRNRRRDIAAEVLAEVECEHLARRYPATLSGGEKQRVALARALAAAPDMLLLDEPLAAMDVAARRDMRNYLGRYLSKHRRPAIVVTHDPRDVRVLRPAAVYALEAGRVVQSGPPALLASVPATAFVAEFFDGYGA